MKPIYVDMSTRSIADVVARDEDYLITRINVPAVYRGHGHGTALLKRILEDADAEREALVLEPSPSGGIGPAPGLNFRQLVDWYARHGFQPVTDASGLWLFMRRMPQ